MRGRLVIPPPHPSETRVFCRCPTRLCISMHGQYGCRSHSGITIFGLHKQDGDCLRCLATARNPRDYQSFEGDIPLHRPCRPLSLIRTCHWSTSQRTNKCSYLKRTNRSCLATWPKIGVIKRNVTYAGSQISASRARYLKYVSSTEEA